MTAFRRYYGSSPLHLLALLGCFALAAAAGLQWFHDEQARLRYLLWFVGAIVVHDLVLFPLYTLLDRSVGSLLRRRRTAGKLPTSRGAINYFRVPAVLSGTLLLVFAPVILRHSEDSFRFASGLSQDPYLVRWLTLNEALFLGSALLYAARGRPHAYEDHQ